MKHHGVYAETCIGELSIGQSVLDNDISWKMVYAINTVDTHTQHRYMGGWAVGYQICRKRVLHLDIGVLAGGIYRRSRI